MSGPERSAVISGSKRPASLYEDPTSMLGTSAGLRQTRRLVYRGSTSSPLTESKDLGLSLKSELYGNLAHGARFSADSTATAQTYHTATSFIGSWRTAPSFIDEGGNNSRDKAGVLKSFRKLLERGGLSPLTEGDDEESDWCGMGMHVDFTREDLIPLEIQDSLGHGSTATVDIVKCRRVKLARKLTRLHRQTSQKNMLKEVQALHMLKHAHIVQLVGTYKKGRTFATLLYPVADMDLAVYLEEARDMLAETNRLVSAAIPQQLHHYTLSKSSLCLVSALRYIHQSGLKHMDIKPANILLKERKTPSTHPNDSPYSLYLCDFGIAHVFSDESQSDEYFGKTPRYASPEVVAGDLHGRASDIFSMGCVLAEMVTVYCGLSIESLHQYLHGRPYHENLLSRGSILSWIAALDSDMEVDRKSITKMLQADPHLRPTLHQIEPTKDDNADNVLTLSCVHDHDGPDVVEVDEPEFSSTISTYGKLQIKQEEKWISDFASI